jgi:UDP-N-acetylglucosamine--N-acetylmuramyl-(pentapeptide) pyrophosphoryl-undecaprenol N-acetylglucosamine transferase
MSALRTILIASGGTGGHLYPTIAIADEIKRWHPDIRIVFIGTPDRIEAREVPRAGYPFEAIEMQAPGKSATSLVKFPFILARAVMRSRGIIQKHKPVAILCGGAYLTVPIGIAARMLSIPLALLEINSIAGKANKLLSRWADKIFLAYPESRKEFASVSESKFIICGTPVRLAFGSHTIDAAKARIGFGLNPDRETILVFGGSLGARSINGAIATNATAITDAGFNLLWQVGKGNDAEGMKAKFASNVNVSVQEYIYEMESAYDASDLVISRAGASSLAELSVLGKPAILVPYPLAAENHQEANARAFEAEGAAVVIPDSALGENLLPTLLGLMQSSETRQKMSLAMKARENKEAAKIVGEWLASR